MRTKASDRCHSESAAADEESLCCPAEREAATGQAFACRGHGGHRLPSSPAAPASAFCSPRSLIGLAALLLLGAAAPPARADLRATATLQPAEIRAGDAAQLQIVVEGASNISSPEIPAVSGLEFQSAGHSSNFSFTMINGVMSGGGTTTFAYRVFAQKDGLFTIPEITIKAGNATAKTSPLKLRVFKQPSAWSVPMPPGQQPPAPQTPGPQSAPPQPPTASPTGAAEPAMIRLQYPQRDFYVGEFVPVDLKVYLRHGLRIGGISLPTLSGTAFTVGKLGTKPEEAGETIQGTGYTVLTWHTTVAAVKTGEHPLGAQIDCNIMVPVQRNLPRGFGGLFDQLFDSHLGGFQEKQVQLKTPDATVKILPLPAEGQPADFSGAVGQFDFMVKADPKEVLAGDPVTLTMLVTGVGNFDRIQAPEFPRNQGFKTYQPSARFEPTTEAGNMGQKIFDQVAVPQKSEIKQIPGISFTFFDPESRKYVTRTSTPIPLQVSGGMATAPPASALTAGGSTPMPSSSSAPNRDVTDLMPNKLEMGSPQAGVTPLVFKSWFWGVQSLSVAAWMIAWAVARQRNRLARDPDFARAIAANRAVQTQVKAMDAALRKGDATAFFNAARRAFQERLGQRRGLKPETITLAEITGRLHHDPAVDETVQKIFEAADAVAYSGQAYGSQTLDDWRHLVLQTLKKMDAAS